ncbi:hypothetical protein D1871_11570 [Nakamurella silvestris]|nr:hypothetical protein D1871_11570 [Nakamurella silvestris]
MSVGSREAVLNKIRTALDGQKMPGPIPREYDTHGQHAPGSEHVIETLVDRLEDYKALVVRVGPADLADTVSSRLQGFDRIVVPAGLPAEVLEACRRVGRTVFVDGDPAILSAAELDEVQVVVTASRVTVALTGTIVLDGAADQGRRAISLVPDRHLCLVRADQIVETLPEALHLLEATRPLTMISGPSATSDIELNRVEGVHGPRTLDVVIIENS